MNITCICEHNGNDSLLYAVELPGAYSRGESPEIALRKMKAEIRSYGKWAGITQEETTKITILHDVPSALNIADADSDVLFPSEQLPLTPEEYAAQKTLALKSAADFLLLYEAIPDKHRFHRPIRKTFYGQVPRTAEEMYLHTRNVNAYYFGEIGVDADNTGTILDCRKAGFAALEQTPDFLKNLVLEGSYGEHWSLRKLLRRFIWHDRIHAKAMYRMAVRIFGQEPIPDPFFFEVCAYD